jgi:tripartite-type tricarboxylate transporter receptor subunit TctC
MNIAKKASTSQSRAARTLAALAFMALSAGALPHAAMAQTSGQPIRILYGFAAGSAGDLLARVVAERMQATLGQSVVVENRVGASGRIAIMAIKNGPSDGSLLFISPNGPLAITPLFDPNVGYDPVVDFAPVSQLVTFDFSLAIATSIPAKSLAELVPWLKSNPDKAAYGTPGPGTNLHFMGIAFSNAANIALRPVHYRGSAPALNDVVADQLPMMITPLSDQIEQYRNGKVRVMATAGDKRSSFAPEVPTFQEAGFNVRANGWYSAFASSKTPPATIERLNKAMVEAVNTPSVKQRLEAIAFETTGTSPEVLRQSLAKEIETWTPIVKASGYNPGD